MKVGDEGCHSGVVIFSSFFQHFILAGYYFMHGLIYPDLVLVFGAGKVATAWLGSLQVGLSSMLGILAGPLVVVYGCSLMCGLGSTIAALGYIFSSFVNTYPSFLITFSIIPAIGNSVLYVGACVVVQQQIQRKRRSIATSITTSGIPIGTLTFGIICRWFLDVYGWRGNLLFLGGIMLNGIPLAMLIRKPNNNRQTKTSNELVYEKYKSQSNGLTYTKDQTKELSSKSEPPKTSVTSNEKTNINTKLITDKNHTENGALLLQNGTTEKQNNRFNLMTHYKENSITLRQSLKQIRSQLDDTLQQIVLGIEDLREGACLVMFIVSLLFCMGFPGYYVFLPIKALEMGENTWKAAFLVSVLGVSDLIGRLISGLLGNACGGRMLSMYCLGVLLCGIGSFAISISHSYEILLIAVVLSGSGLGVVLSQLAPTATELFGVCRIARVFGMLQVAFGIGTLISPPLQAFMYEQFQDVNTAFLFAAIAQTTGAIIGFIYFFVFSKTLPKFDESSSAERTVISRGIKSDDEQASSFSELNSRILFNPIVGSNLSLHSSFHSIIKLNSPVSAEKVDAV